MSNPSGVYVRAKGADSRWGAFDALDLDDASFRRFVLRALVDANAVCAIRDEAALPVDLHATTVRRDDE